MKKRILKISIICIAIIFTLLACLLLNAFVGNPVSKALARRTAEKHVESVYQQGYTVKTVSYSYKEGGYYAHISSPDSIDGDFTLTISMLGKLKYDDYSWRVSEHSNVANRLLFEYRDIVDTVLEGPDFQYTLNMGYGSLEFDLELGEDEVEGFVDRNELVNDMLYDVKSLGATNGELVLYVDSDTVTLEKASEILLKTKELMDKAGISFYSVYLVVQYPPYDANKPYERPQGEIILKDFLYADIYENGITERVESVAKDTQEYFEKQDALKNSQQ